MSEYTIGRRQLYILPTRVGWYYVLILISLFAIAVKFDNQAAFMMLFALVAISIIGMHYTHNNVIGLQLTSNSAKPIFVGETAHFPVRVENHHINFTVSVRYFFLLEQTLSKFGALHCLPSAIKFNGHSRQW